MSLGSCADGTIGILGWGSQARGEDRERGREKVRKSEKEITFQHDPFGEQRTSKNENVYTPPLPTGFFPPPCSIPLDRDV